jgi:hypothetical protein
MNSECGVAKIELDEQRKWSLPKSSWLNSERGVAKIFELAEQRKWSCQKSSWLNSECGVAKFFELAE